MNRLSIAKQLLCNTIMSTLHLPQSSPSENFWLKVLENYTLAVLLSLSSHINGAKALSLQSHEKKRVDALKYRSAQHDIPNPIQHQSGSLFKKTVKKSKNWLYILNFFKHQRRSLGSVSQCINKG